MKKLTADFGPAVASALLLATAFHPLNLTFVIFAALFPWLRYLQKSTGKQALKSGAVFGAVYFGLQMLWLLQFVQKWTGSWVMALLPWVLAILVGVAYFSLLGWLLQRCFSWRMPLLIPLVWAGVEAIRATVPGLAFPWANIGHPMWAYPGFVQMAAFGTVSLVSAWVVLGNLLVLTFLSKQGESPFRGPRQVMAVTVAFAGLMLISYGRMSSPTPPTTEMVVTLGQPGVDMAFTPPDIEREQLEMATSEIVAAALVQKSDLLVLPEGYAGRAHQFPPISPVGPQPPVPVIMGGNWEEGDTMFQSAFMWDGESEWTRVDKTRLVVFGEYVPLRDQLKFLQSFNLPAGDLTPADKLVTPTLNGVVLGPVICFEGVFAELAEQHSNQGAQILVQMSIDDWYEDTWAYPQLWQQSVWRSIESGLPIVRVGSRGQSLATDLRGNVTTMVPVGDRVGARALVRVPERSDAFAHRTKFWWICYAACAFAIVAPVVWKRRTSETEQAPSRPSA